MPTAPHRITDTQSLTIQGCAIVERCIEPHECDNLAARFATTNHVGCRCLLDEDWCQGVARRLRARLIGIAPEIAELVAVQCTYFSKSPNANWLVAYHQDRSIPVDSGVPTDLPGHSIKEGVTFVHGPDELLSRMLAVRLHLDDSMLNNGPLRVIPGSHLAGTLSPEQIDGLRNACPEQPLLVRRGGAILMRPLLLHASSKSQSSSNRRVLHFLFAPPSPTPGLKWRIAV